MKHVKIELSKNYYYYYYYYDDDDHQHYNEYDHYNNAMILVIYIANAAIISGRLAS